MQRLAGMARWCLVAAVIVASLAIAACGKSGDDAGGSGNAAETTPAKSTDKLVINSFGGDWGNAIQKGFIDDFERETGIDVQLLSTADPAKSKLAIQSGNEPPEDIMDYDYGTAVSLQQDNLLAPIDYSVFPADVKAQVPEQLRQRYAVGWGGFAIALCYDKRKFASNPPQTWADFWDFDRYPGKRGMVAWPVQPQPEFGLLAAGVSADALYPLDLDKAVAQLKALQPHVPKFADSPATLQQQLVDGTISMAACYANRASALIAQGNDNVGISFQGARLIDDYFMVWRNAPNRANAMKFLAFVHNAEQQAKWARIGYTAPVNDDALKHLPASVTSKLPPPGEAFQSDDTYYTTSDDSGRTNQERVIDAWNAEIGS